MSFTSVGTKMLEKYFLLFLLHTLSTTLQLPLPEGDEIKIEKDLGEI